MVNIEHYPKDFQEFLSQCKSENDCWDYIFEIRWPNGFICSKCNGDNYWLTEQKLLRVLYFKEQGNPYCFGFTLYGGSWHKKQGQVLTISKILWVLVHMKPHGLGYTNCAVRWFDQRGISLLGR